MNDNDNNTLPPENEALSIEAMQNMSAQELETELLRRNHNPHNTNDQAYVDRQYAAIDEKVAARRSKSRQRPPDYEQKRNNALAKLEYVAFNFHRLFTVEFFVIAAIVLFITETISVAIGLHLIIQDVLINNPTVSWILIVMTSAVTVLTYTIILWQYHVYESVNGKPKHVRFTFYKLASDMKYTLFGKRVATDKTVTKQRKDWRGKQTGEYTETVYARDVDYIDDGDYWDIYNTLRGLEWSIIAASLLARVGTLMLQMPQSVVNPDEILLLTQLKYALQNFGLANVIGIITIFVLTKALLRATHYVLRYLQLVSHKAFGTGNSADFLDSSLEEEVQREKADVLKKMYILRLNNLLKKEQDAQAKEQQVKEREQAKAQLKAQLAKEAALETAPEVATVTPDNATYSPHAVAGVITAKNSKTEL